MINRHNTKKLSMILTVRMIKVMMILVDDDVDEDINDDNNEF